MLGLEESSTQPTRECDRIFLCRVGKNSRFPPRNRYVEIFLPTTAVTSTEILVGIMMKDVAADEDC
ncbi:MAG: hypothetical protein F6K47_34475 [Symploca sp. SIO2E6]|nr:hypothetical protein [Symploca sp. SIO2E6]